MIYLNYYSKLRNTLDGNLDRMIATEKNKIVTKVITCSDWSNIRRTNLLLIKDALQINVETWMRTHTQPMTDYYTEFRIPKQSGGYRTIKAPDEQLKKLQQQVLAFLIQDCKLLCHNAVHSYVKYRNCKTAMEVHQKHGARWFLKLDIKDFFDGCQKELVLEMLTQIHPLCTMSSRSLKTIFDVCFLYDALPQGAPTSPMLSNLYLQQFDVLLTQALQGYTYTRYADDILISKTTQFNYTEITQLVDSLLPQGLMIKREKIRYGSCNGTNWNLGLMYNKDREITVGYRNKHRVKNQIHNLFNEPYNTYNVYSEEWVGWFNRLCKLKGTLAYYKFIEPEYFDNLIQRYKAKGYTLL